MLFKNEMVYTEADFIAFMRLYTQKTDKLRRMEKVTVIAAKAVSAVLLLAGAINLLTMYKSGQWELFMGAASAALIVVGFLMSAVVIEDLSGKRAWRQYQGQGMRITYTFDDKAFAETRQGNTRTYRYADIVSLMEDEGHYYLFISEASAHILCKNAFKEGDSAGFGSFISRRTGLEINAELDQNKKKVAAAEKAGDTDGAGDDR